jgi:hypothetical protein
MDLTPESQTSVKSGKKLRRAKSQTPAVANFETLLLRRQELTLLAHKAQDKLDVLKAQLVQAEADAENAWDQAIDMNAVIREELTRLRNEGLDDKTIYDLIDYYNTV